MSHSISVDNIPEIDRDFVLPPAYGTTWAVFPHQSFVIHECLVADWLWAAWGRKRRKERWLEDRR